MNAPIAVSLQAEENDIGVINIINLFYSLFYCINIGFGEMLIQRMRKNTV